MQDALPENLFERQDEMPDSLFYSQPRLVYHIDEYAVAAVTEAYRRFLPPSGKYLDLMSSWVSHFPPEMTIRHLVGHGMNEVELQRNTALSEYFVQDLNVNPVLPFADGTFDGVVICVSIQYLTRPVDVFREIARVLKPAAPLIVSFSNRCFPSKAVRIWRSINDEQHGRLVGMYAQAAGGFEAADFHDFSPRLTLIGVPEDTELRRRVTTGEIYTDPLYVVVVRRSSLPEEVTGSG
ncbi:MAG TPA: methyltransferase domain-containing protein [Dehalococcoidia bacterium]|nr:methyltransferase domain-containing protein [Dehalococcoidia bacterium]